MSISIVIAMLFLSGVPLQQPAPPEQQLVVSGPKVIFFHPTKAEVDSVVQNEGLEITDLLDDYDYASGRAAYYLSMVKLSSEYTDSRIIIVKLSRNRVRRFDRKHVADPVGMILTDGDQEPRLVAGPREEAQLISEINRFFHIE